MIKYLAILIAVSLIGSVMSLAYAQEPRFITMHSGETVDIKSYYAKVNTIMPNAVTECTMAAILQLNATTVITCTDSMVNFNKKVCEDKDLAPNVDVCKYGIVKHFVDTYGPNNTSLGE